MFQPRAASGPREIEMPSFSNWGRWGDADEIGAANHLDASAVVRAAGLVRRGVAVRLGQVLGDRNSPRTRESFSHFMMRDGGDYLAGLAAPEGFKAATDHISLPIHGATTHLDALGHAWYGDQLYNGYPEALVRSQGLRKLGIDKVPPLVTRGVLVDLPASMGVEILSAGYEITPDDIEKALDTAGVELMAGDAVLLRTGWKLMWSRDKDAYLGDRPGIGIAASEWLATKDVTLVGADNSGVEVIPWAPGTVCPVHQFLIRDCGVYLLEFLDLEELADLGATEFMFVAAPIAVRGGTGGPISPVAVL